MTLPFLQARYLFFKYLHNQEDFSMNNKQKIISTCVFLFHSFLPMYAFKTTLSGYLKSDYFVDSRQSFGSSDGYNLFYPLMRNDDFVGVDIHRKGQSQIMALASRVKLTVDASGKLKSRTKGVFEVDINGRNNISHLFRIRHAFFETEYDQFMFLAGHTWHPFYQSSHAPTLISNNSGQPFETYSRHPQMRLTFSSGNTSLIGALLSQVDFCSDGPLGNDNIYLFNSMIPELHVQLQQVFSGQWIAFGVDFKKINPRIVTDKNFSVREYVHSVMAGIMGDFTYKKCNLKTKLMYAQNASEMVLMGGYAASSVDQSTDYRTYTPLSSISWWAQLSYKINDAVEPALFVGYSYNLGASDPVILSINNTKTVYGFGTNIKQLARVSPRIRFTLFEVLECAGELEYTHAWHGTLQTSGKVTENVKGSVGVVRMLASTRYCF